MQTLRWIKQNFIIILISLIGIGAVSGYLVYRFVFSPQATESQSSDDNAGLKVEKSNPENEDVFPEVKAQDFYHLLTVNSDNEAVISEDLIAEVIRAVMTGVSRTDGELTAGVKIYDDQNVRVDFKWENKSLNLEFFKQYVISIINRDSDV